MKPAALLRWLIARTPQQIGIPLSTIDQSASTADSLISLEQDGSVLIDGHRLRVYVHPKLIKPKRKKSRTHTWLESDLPSDVERLEHIPDRDSQPMPGKRNGDRMYRAPLDPPDLYATGSQAWPPDGCRLQHRQYRERDTRIVIHEMEVDVTTDPKLRTPPEIPTLHARIKCPVCDRIDRNEHCLACDAKPWDGEPIPKESWCPEEDAHKAKELEKKLKLEAAHKEAPAA